MVEDVLQRLRDRLQEQSRMPPLPAGWRWESAMMPAHGVDYGGDFFVSAELVTGPYGHTGAAAIGLQMVLVDVCGHGTAALPDALQLAGALRGIIRTVAPDGVMAAVNDYLLDLDSDEAIATAAHVVLDYVTGRYRISSAGHPPVLRWEAATGACRIDSARGTTLGVVPEPELEVSEGVLASGDALAFYTDGVVESREQDLDTGIAWLCGRLGSEIADGAGAAARIIAQVPRGDDDRALLILGRE